MLPTLTIASLKPLHQQVPLTMKHHCLFFDKILAAWSSLENACIVMTIFSQLQSKCHFSEVNETEVCFSYWGKYLSLLKYPFSLSICTTFLEVWSWGAFLLLLWSSCLGLFSSASSHHLSIQPVFNKVPFEPLCSVFLYLAITRMVRDNWQ